MFIFQKDPPRPGELFGSVRLAPPDPILGTTTAFKEDTDPRKINLGVGAYRTEEGAPYVLDVVREAEYEVLRELEGNEPIVDLRRVGGMLSLPFQCCTSRRPAEGMPLMFPENSNNKEYSAIDGPDELKWCTRALAFGNGCPAIQQDRIASVHALSGTGALRIVGEFVKEHLPYASRTVLISDPTWGNHPTIFEKAGLSVQKYPYWNEATRSLNFEGMLYTLSRASAGSLVLLHACAHNPTGVDPTREQWQRIAQVMKERQLIPLLDSAYQGYASGDLDQDAFAVRLFLREGFELFLCQSFAKNLGLYGERIGMVHVVCATQQLQQAVTSQLKMIIRPMYSSPPKHGALLVTKILGEPARFNAWRQELKCMAERILQVRGLLRAGLEEKKTPGTWNHITDQIGMFSFTGLKPAECERLIKEHHIYLLKSGRISLAGLNQSNVQYMVDSMDEVIRACAG